MQYFSIEIFRKRCVKFNNVVFTMPPKQNYFCQITAQKFYIHLESMKASQIIAESFICRQAARNIYPQDPDELFNTVWLRFAEKEIQDPAFNPADPKRYFLKAMRNQVIDWQRQEQSMTIDQINEREVITHDQSNSPGKAFIDEWINAPTEDEDLLFLKNILTLALNTNRNNDVIKMIGISNRQYYTYKKLAKQRLYADYHASNNCDLPGLDMV